MLRGDGGIGGPEPETQFAFRILYAVPAEIIEDRFPVHAFVAKPVRPAGVFVIAEIRVKSGEQAAHAAGVLYRYGLVGIAVKDIHTVIPVVIGQGDHIAGIARPEQHALSGRKTVAGGNPPVMRSVGRQGRIPGTGGDGGEMSGICGPEVPGAMSAHRMTREINPLRIRVELCHGNIQNLHRVHPSPVLPVESPRTTVGGGYEYPPVLRPVGPGLADGLHLGSVNRQKECRCVCGRSRPGCHAVVLYAAVDAAHEGAAVMRTGSSSRQVQLRFADHPQASHQLQTERYLPGLVYLRRVEAKRHLAETQGGHGG